MKKITTYLLGFLLCGTLASQPALSNIRHKTKHPANNFVQMAEKIKIFPNPTDGRFQLSMTYEGSERIIAKVYDITGKVIKDISGDLVKSESSVTAEVDLDHPSSGIYFLRVEIGNKILTRKIVVK